MTSARAALIAAALAAPLAVRAEPPNARPFQLPPFIVDDTTMKYSAWNWGYMAFPGYEVLTYCNRTTTNSFVTGIDQQLANLRWVAPVLFESQPAVPTSLILMDTSQEATISSDMQRVMNEHGAGHNSGTFGATHIPQLRLNDSESTAINFVLGEQGALEAIILEPGYVRYLLETRRPRLPTWYVEAVTRLYEAAVFSASDVTFPPVAWVSGKETEALLADPRRKEDLLPMDVILYTRPASDGSDPVTKLRVLTWESQSDLLLHWVIADKKGGRLESLTRLIHLGDTGVRGERALKDSFGLDYGQMQETLSSFLHKSLVDSVAVHDDPLPVTEHLRDATKAEYGRIWGNWELMEIRYVDAQDPLLTFPYIAQADTTLRTGYKRGERSPGFLAMLGLYDIDMNDPERAAPVLEAAAAAEAAYPRVYVELARLRFKHAMAVRSGGRIPRSETDRILALLARARRLPPPQASAYTLEALTLANGAAAPTAGELGDLDEGLHLFPSDSELATAVAAIKDRPPAVPLGVEASSAPR